ncbi:MAG TPA: cupin domain-containing protein [Verrucomicrobiae bacterium]
MSKAIIQPPEGGTRYLVLGDEVLVKVHGKDTKGLYSQVSVGGLAGKGPPMHIHHRENETFYCISGEFKVICAGTEYKLTPGMVAHLPQGVPHRFEASGPGDNRMLVTITPAGFEGFFEEVGAMSAEEQQQNIPQVIAIGEKYGLEFLRE